MNRIEMYSSSSDLRGGLQRVLAVAHGLSEPMPDGETIRCWPGVGDEPAKTAPRHQTSLDQLSAIFAQPSVREMLDDVHARFELPAVDHDLAQRAFRAAIISGRAHRAHLGRDIYGVSNKTVWDLLCAPLGEAIASRFGRALGESAIDRSQSRPSEPALRNLEGLLAFDTSPTGNGHEGCVEWLTERLILLGFQVEIARRGSGRPLVVARRHGRGLGGHVVMYGHYDVVPIRREERWQHPPRELTDDGERLFARGVADNLGPLACRLAAVSSLSESPALTWIIQGEEETGSRVAHALLPELIAAMEPATLWLDETGYHDVDDGTLRLLARVIAGEDGSRSPDRPLDELLRALRALASRWGVGARLETRGLNKNLVEGGCPFNRNIPEGARYLAVGVNDSAARIHRTDESVPQWTFPLHVAELEVIFRWAGRPEGGS